MRTPAQLLDLIRQGTIFSWESLCQSVGMPFFDFIDSNEASWWLNRLLVLVDTGFVEFEPSDADDGASSANGIVKYRPPKRHFKATNQWQKVHSALGVGLSDLARIDPPATMIVRPFFGSAASSNTLDLFVVMPFIQELEPVYTNHIKPIAAELGLSVLRGDDLFAPTSIVEDIWKMINQAKIIVADCTTKNPNVFYELGIAHTIGKPTVLITQDENDVPFDVQHIRYIKYEYTLRGMQVFATTLKQFLQEELLKLDNLLMR